MARGQRIYDRRAVQGQGADAGSDRPIHTPHGWCDRLSGRLHHAEALGCDGADVGKRRPDLVVRFGRGPKLPSLLRRPVEAVLV